MTSRETGGAAGTGSGAPSRAWVLVAVAVGALLLGGLLGTCAVFLASRPDDDEPDTVTVVRPTPNVVVAVRDLARLESAEFHMERVIDLRDRQSRLFGLVESEDALLLVAAGDVIAGVDLAESSDDDVVVDSETHTATVTLPAPRVLVTRLDNEHTYVHSRDTGLLAERSETLETRARQEAERTLEESAVEAGLLDRARANTAATVRTLVQALGYESVEVRFR